MWNLIVQVIKEKQLLTLGRLQSHWMIWWHLREKYNYTKIKTQRNAQSFQSTLLKCLAKCDYSYDCNEYYHKEELKLIHCQRV